MCDCVHRVNEKLRDQNGVIVSGFGFGAASVEHHEVCVWVEKIKPKGKRPPAVIASHCPFCGRRFADETSTP